MRAPRCSDRRPTSSRGWSRVWRASSVERLEAQVVRPLEVLEDRTVGTVGSTDEIDDLHDEVTAARDPGVQARRGDARGGRAHRLRRPDRGASPGRGRATRRRGRRGPGERARPSRPGIRARTRKLPIAPRRRVLPIPASPDRSSSCPWPEWTSSSRRWASAITSSRPTITGESRDSACDMRGSLRGGGARFIGRSTDAVSVGEWHGESGPTMSRPAIRGAQGARHGHHHRRSGELDADRAVLRGPRQRHRRSCCCAAGRWTAGPGNRSCTRCWRPATA